MHVPFTARVTTYGDAACTRGGGATVTTAGRIAVVVPVDSTGGVAMCLRAIATFPRSVSVVLDQAGQGTVVVQGADTTVAKTVVVR